MLFLLIFTVDYTPYGRGLPARLFSFYSGDGLRVSAEISLADGRSGDRDCDPWTPMISFAFRRRAAAVPSSSADVGSSTRQVVKYDVLFFPFPSAGREFMRWGLQWEDTALWDVGFHSSLAVLLLYFSF